MTTSDHIYQTVTYDLNKQGVELPGTRPSTGGTGIYRNANFTKELLETNQKGVYTLYDAFNRGLRLHPDNKCAGHRELNRATGVWSDYIWETYKDIDVRRNNFGSGMLQLYDTIVMGGKKGQWPVGIYANNRPEWLITDQANNAYSLITTSLYDTLGPETVEYCINHAEIPIVVTSIQHVPVMLRLAGQKKIPVMKVLIVIDDLEDSAADTSSLAPGELARGSLVKAWGKQAGVQVFGFKEVEELGKQHPRPHNPPQPNDLTSICYTSGTTGMPKGAMLTHRNMLSAVQAGTVQISYEPDDTLISYLPLAHIYGRLVECSALCNGAAIGYFRGDVLKLIEDMQVLKPTHFPSVPRLLNRIAARIKAATIEAPGVAGALSRRAFAAKTERLLSGGGFEHALWDRLVIRKVKAVLGGRVRMVISGAAPIAPQTLTFLRVALACIVVEGYGQTEGAATTICQVPREFRAGDCGPPMPCNEVKLIDVKEMGFSSTDKPFPRGELLYRGPNAFVGYYKDDKKTRETIDADGWIHTGDVALVDDRGCFKIIDRTKNLIKLEQGEYVAVEKVENTYLSFGSIGQIFVHGESLRNYLVAIIVPDPESLATYLGKKFGQTVAPTDADGLAKACQDPKVIEAFQQEMNAVAKSSGLLGFETVKKIYLTMEPFTVENVLTPTLKVKRNVARDYYKKEIDAMYGGGEPASSSAGSESESKAKL